jgi:hypothetical protein
MLQVLLCVVVCVFNYVHGMNHKIIPLFSLQTIHSGYDGLADGDNNCVSHILQKSILFSLAVCPKEIRHKILTIMLDDDPESGKLFDTMPILKAFELYHKLKPLNLGNKTYSIGRLFRLSSEKRNELTAICKPSTAERVVGKNQFLIINKDCETMRNMPKDIRSGLKFNVIPQHCLSAVKIFTIPTFLGIVGVLFSTNLSLAAAGWCCMETIICSTYHYALREQAIEVELS